MLNASFILPTKNVAKFIGPLLDSIYAQEYAGDIDVLIMDSSDDQTPEIVRKYPVQFITVDPDDYNYGKTRNEGAALVTGDILVFLSTDVAIVDRNWLANLCRHFADPAVAGVFGRQVPKPDSTPMEHFFINYNYPAKSEWVVFGEGTMGKRFAFFSNVNSAMRRSTWEKIKLPEMLKSEEIEWAKRALLAGYKIYYDADASVLHSHHYTLKSVFQEYFDTGAGLPVIQKDRPRAFSMKDFIVNGMGFVGNEYKFMLQNKSWYWIPYAIIYDLSKFFGMFLGAKQQYMPLWMKRALCKKKNHWDRYSAVIKEGT